jgi:hypothetical protein
VCITRGKVIIEVVTTFFSILETIYNSEFVAEFKLDRTVVLLSSMVWGWYCIGFDNVVYTACARLRSGGKCNLWVAGIVHVYRADVTCAGTALGCVRQRIWPPSKRRVRASRW